MREYKITERGVFGALAVVSLLAGLSIFFFVHTGFLRNYGGDIIAIVFLYSALRAIFQLKPIIATAVVLGVAIGIELLQALTSLPRGAVSALTLGSTFDLLDILAYVITALTLYAFDSGLRASSSASAS